eukprot:CAMPEP_0176446282 /NCGR_PEP_ID=MMETSP0127-20121128/24222_1 /TAXON_ID=938130 /ORGANISM="Platyophrya macrostoma, Strain WH" /LENGTH=314 /DNA_ID=CAMNT_0017832265 /DNA_START=63 /DNA_END=1007 /DNA_ORIENTATION=+
MDYIKRKVLQSSLFASGPFYCYPWKPTVNDVCGDSYEVALKHFKAGHYGMVNFALHGACLFLQVAGNLAFLSKVDRALGGSALYQMVGAGGFRLLTWATVVAWARCLAVSPAPKLVTLTSIAVLVLGGVATGAHDLTAAEYETGSVAALLAAFLASNVLAPKRQKIGFKKAVAFLAGFCLWGYGWRTALAHSSILQDLVSDSTKELLVAGYVAFLAVTSVLPNPLKKIVIGSTLLSRIVGLFTGNELVWFHGEAFFASLCQVVSHGMTKEEATLLALERQRDEDKVRFEYAHVVYFPNILLQSFVESLQSTSKQ